MKSFEVVWTDEALAAAMEYMDSDRDGLEAVFAASDRLAEDPRPADSRAWGGSGVYRLRVYRYRLLYEIEETVVRISVLHLGRV